MIEEFSNAKWLTLYQEAILEADYYVLAYVLADRIHEARLEIENRLTELEITVRA